MFLLRILPSTSSKSILVAQGTNEFVVFHMAVPFSTYFGEMVKDLIGPKMVARSFNIKTQFVTCTEMKLNIVKLVILS
jgi:hypothetical protein